MAMLSQVRRHGPVRSGVVVLAVGAAAVLAACSSSTNGGANGGANGGTSAPGTPSPSVHSESATANQATCKHVNALRVSLADLSSLQLNASSAAKIRSDLTSIQTQLAALKAQDGGHALSSQVNQLSTSLDKVKKAGGNLSTPPTASQVTAIVNALSGLKAQSKAAAPAMRTACP
jgi:hypothetical protein